MPINIEIKDERENKSTPPLLPEHVDVQKVLDHANIVTDTDEVLNVTVILLNAPKGAKAGEERNVPTSILRQGTKEEIRETKFVDAITEKEIAVNQKFQVPDPCSWEIRLFLIEKEEVSFGMQRALSRAISRDVFTISSLRAYGDAMSIMYPDPKAFYEASKTFADDAPWAVS